MIARVPRCCLVLPGDHYRPPPSHVPCLLNRVIIRNSGKRLVLGLRREGHLRENLRVDDTWADSLIFAVLDHEWG